MNAEGRGAGQQQAPTGNARDQRGDLSDRSIGDLVGRLSNDLSTLLRQELELAKAEVRQDARRAGKAGGLLVAGAMAGLVGLLIVSWAVAWALALALPTWLAFFIVAAVYAVVAGILITVGRKQLQQLNPTPEHTVESLKEDKEWLRHRT